MSAEFRSRVLSAIKWTAGARMLSQLINWGITIFVVRLLTPSDYGLLAMATVVVGFVMLLSELGIGSALVQARTVEEKELSQVFGLSLSANLLLCLMLVLTAPTVAGFFEEPRLGSIIRALALQLPLAALYVVPQSLVERRLEFKAKSLVDLSGTLLSGVITLASALAGLGVWALVAGSLAKVFWSALGLNLAVGSWTRPSFELGRIWHLVTFGGYVTGSRLLWYLFSQADVLIAGKLLGKVELGYYSVSMHLASLPVQRLSSIVNEVAFPAFSRIQDDRQRIVSYLLKTVRVLSLLSVPVLWGTSSVSPELVRVLLGAKWEDAILPLQILGLVMPVRMMSNITPAIVQGLGRPDITFKNVAFSAVVMPVALLIGCQWGIVGLAVAWLIASPLVFIRNLTRGALRILGVPLKTFFRAAAAPAAAGALMYLSVVAARWAARVMGFGDAAQLAVLVTVGAITYLIATLMLNRSGLREAIDLFRRA